MKKTLQRALPMTLLPEDALPSGGLKPHQIHLQPYHQRRLTATAHLTFQGYCVQVRAIEEVEGEKATEGITHRERC